MKRLFEVRIKRGRSNPNWIAFSEGVNQLNGKGPDFGGITSCAIIGTHHDELTVAGIIGSSAEGISITEITDANVNEPEFAIYHRLIDQYFLPFGDYPAVTR